MVQPAGALIADSRSVSASVVLTHFMPASLLPNCQTKGEQPVWLLPFCLPYAEVVGGRLGVDTTSITGGSIGLVLNSS